MRSAQKEMPVLEHIREVRRTMLISLAAYVVACIVAFAFADRIINLFTEPFTYVVGSLETTMVISSIAEGFLAQLRMTVIAGLILSLPIHVFGIIRFVFPGLTAREKRIILIFLAVSLVFIVVGTYFVYFLLVPLVIDFLTRPLFVPQTVGIILNYYNNIFYILTFILCAVLALQAPILMEILLILNVIKRRQVWKAIRFIIVGIFILSALVTPPDVASLLGIALPLIVFFFLALLIAKIFNFGDG
jgi:sec-independent protein translocase protein TatC